MELSEYEWDLIIDCLQIGIEEYQSGQLTHIRDVGEADKPVLKDLQNLSFKLLAEKEQVG